jgi:RNA polymerase sigma factor (sigma-70 family)
MTAPGSITHWLDQLRAGDADASDQAGEEIWRRYAPSLLALARRHLDQQLCQRVDENDVLQSMYKSFCLRQQRGEFNLTQRDDLWHLLVAITLRKVRDVAKHHGRERREHPREGAEQPEPTLPAGPQEICDRLPAGSPPPEEIAVFTEELQRRLQALPPELRQIALWKLEGYTNEEIAGPDLLNCSPRTVERKLERIRGKWRSSAQRNGPAAR